ncbi:hypothetical protein DQ04_00201050 [Trypanosoma grayi]|uniref:hypothetical protein n=1 Tax=Trypanosoma grayi TaxID=71804 RepID=UPI0004F3F343|nr:hypothetical protein DQ04_00201050 [Trypanosoma grayi]KEG15052.1 hypothetical protein DQ04_00201050 [Trypanosoma grayi]
MYPAGLVVTTVGTAAVVVPMMLLGKRAEWQKTMPHVHLLSVRDATLASVGGLFTNNTTETISDDTVESLPISKLKETDTDFLVGDAEADTTESSDTEVRRSLRVSALISAIRTSKPFTAAVSIIGYVTKPFSIAASNVSHASKRMAERTMTAVVWVRSHPFIIVGTTTAVTATLLRARIAYTRFMTRRLMMAMDDSEKVQLYIAPRSGAALCASMPCVAVETFLRLAKIPYDAHIIADPAVSPTGSLPCIRYKGNCVSNFSPIMDCLRSTFKIRLDTHIGKQEMAIGTALAATLNYSVRRACDRPQTVHVVAALQQMLSKLQRTFSTWRYGVPDQSQSKWQLLLDFQAIEHIIGSKMYLLGSSPTSYDCAVYAALLPLVEVNETAHARDPFTYVAHSKVLTGYVRRMSHTVFPDLDDLVKA